MPAGAGGSRAEQLVATEIGGAVDRQLLREMSLRPVVLSIDGRLARTRRGQLMTSVAANLLARLAPFVRRVELDVPGHATPVRGIPGLSRVRGFGPSLLELMERSASTAHAPRRLGPSGRTPLAHLAIGAPRPGSGEGVISIDGAGWNAALARGTRAPQVRNSSGGFNPFGPLVAAALGVSEVAKTVFRELAGERGRSRFPALRGPLRWNLWSHDDGDGNPPLPERLDLGSIALAGLGALGSAASYALARLHPITGSVELVDDDAVDRSNLERMITADRDDVGRRKTTVAAHALARRGLRLEVVNERYGVRFPDGAGARVIVVGVDNLEGRRAIARLVRRGPHALYHGGMHGDEILVSRHVRGFTPCLECLYPPEDRVSATAARLGVPLEVAGALVRGERKLDADILTALRARGGFEYRRITEADLLDRPLAALDGSLCSRALVIDALPAATIGFASALGGFLMACELVKDALGFPRRAPLDGRRPVFRLSLFRGVPGPDCLEEWRPRRGCECQGA